MDRRQLQHLKELKEELDSVKEFCPACAKYAEAHPQERVKIHHNPLEQCHFMRSTNKEISARIDQALRQLTELDG